MNPDFGCLVFRYLDHLNTGHPSTVRYLAESRFWLSSIQIVAVNSRCTTTFAHQNAHKALQYLKSNCEILYIENGHSPLLLDAFRLTGMDKPVLFRLNKQNKLKLKNASISVGSHPLLRVERLRLYCKKYSQGIVVF